MRALIIVHALPSLKGLSSRPHPYLTGHPVPLPSCRTADAKEGMRALAGAALAEVPRRQPPGAVLGALAKSLAAARAAKVKIAVLEFFAAAATGSVDLEEALDLCPGPELRALVAGMLPLALDKNADIRRAAVRALGVIYHAEQGQVGGWVEPLGHMGVLSQASPSAERCAVLLLLLIRSCCCLLAEEQECAFPSLPFLSLGMKNEKGPCRTQAVVAGIQALPPNEGAAVQRALEKAVPSLQSDLAAALRASRPAPVVGAGSAAAPTAASSRRHSGEGLLQLPPALLSARGAPSTKLTLPAPAPAPVAAHRGGSKGAGGMASPRGSTLSSPRGPSPLRRSDSSPTSSASSLSRLGRQASGVSACGAAAAAGEHAEHASLARQPSSCVNHTSSPVAAPSALPRTASLPPRPAPDGSPLGRQARGAAEAAGRQQAGDPGAAAAELAPFDDIMEGQLRRLLSQLQGGPSAEAFQGLSRLAHVLPGGAWAPHFSQVRCRAFWRWQGREPTHFSLCLCGEGEQCMCWAARLLPLAWPAMSSAAW